MATTDGPTASAGGRATAALRRIGGRRSGVVAAILGAFALGAVITAIASPYPHATLVALMPAPVAAMRDWNDVAVRGRVAEVFGNKFIIEDESGRALVDTGREGESGKLVAPSESVTVLGRFERGFIHASAIAHADGHDDVLGPPAPRPRRGTLSWLGSDRGFAHWFVRHSPRNG